MILEGQEVFREMHNHREALRDFYKSPLGQLLVRYLNSEFLTKVDELLHGDRGEVRDAVTKGEARMLYALMNLPDYLYSLELKPENEPTGTEV